MPTPHDALFRLTFGDPAHAATLLRALLDPATVAAIDWRTLRRAPDTLLDEQRRDQRADLLFSVRLCGRDAFLLVLPEHKGRPDPWVALQVLAYKTSIWRQLHREAPRKRLPPILPVVVHCGARPWRAVCDLRSLLQLDGMPPQVVAAQPVFACPPHDFASRTPAEVRAMALSLFGLATIASLQFVAPHASDEDATIRRVAEWADVARRIVSDPDGQDAIEALSSYLLSITKLGRRRLRVVIQREFGTPAMKKFVSTLERERIEGRAEGRAEGKAQGKAETLLRQLHKRFGPVPAAVGRKVRNARLADLDRWLERVLDAGSLVAVFARG